jgi:hypothetical protein
MKTGKEPSAEARAVFMVAACAVGALAGGCSRDGNDRGVLGARTAVLADRHVRLQDAPLTTLDRRDWPVVRVESPVDGVVHGPLRRFGPGTREDDPARRAGRFPTAESALDLETDRGGLDLLGGLGGALGELAWMPVDTVLDPPGSARQRVWLWKRSRPAEGSLGWLSGGPTP